MQNLRRLKEFGDRLTFALMIAFVIIITLEAWQYIASLQARPASGAEFERVSLVQLLANPERYDVRKIEAAGLFVLREKQYALFLSKEDAENGISLNSIAVVLPSPEFKQDEVTQLDGKFVSVKGIFFARGAPESAQRVPQIATIEEVRSPPYAAEPMMLLQALKTGPP